MTSTGLLNAFSAWAAEERPLVLASVFHTEGSTYSKAGAQMLITGDGKFQGMLSGGCLEGDLAERARMVIESGLPQSVTYDLGFHDEELWGLGVGCDGLMKIFLQPLHANGQYEPFAAMVRALSGDRVEAAATVIQSDIDALPVGATVVTLDGNPAYNGIADEFAASINVHLEKGLATGESASYEIAADGRQAMLLCSVLQPPPAILVLGAGLDAEPLVRIALELGWRVTVQDHRPAYIESGNFAGVEAQHCFPVDEVSGNVDFDRFSAAVVMSHHLASDRNYLAQLASSRIPYIGLLGPINRRRRLLGELGDLASQLEARLHGPAGINIGGRGPASIALSIISEIHQAVMRP